MIKARFLTLVSGEIIGFNITGHANYSEHGKDIICAAVSSAVYMVANIIVELLKVNAEVSINEKCGAMHVSIPYNEISRCNLIFEGLKIHLLMLEENYPKHIKVMYMEV